MAGLAKEMKKQIFLFPVERKNIIFLFILFITAKPQVVAWYTFVSFSICWLVHKLLECQIMRYMVLFHINSVKNEKGGAMIWGNGEKSFRPRDPVSSLCSNGQEGVVLEDVNPPEILEWRAGTFPGH